MRQFASPGGNVMIIPRIGFIVSSNRLVESTEIEIADDYLLWFCLCSTSSQQLKIGIHKEKCNRKFEPSFVSL